MYRPYNKLATIMWWLHPLSEALRDLEITRKLLRTDWFKIEKRILTDMSIHHDS